MEEKKLDSDQNKSQKRKGLMIASIITFSLGLILFIVSCVFMFDIFSTKDANDKALGFLAFILTYGWFTFVPALAFFIASICTTRFGLRSTDKRIKTTCLVILILSCIILLSMVVLALLLFFTTRN